MPFCLIRSFPTKKDAANNKNLFKGGGSITVSVFLIILDNYDYYQLSIHHVPSNERAGLSTLELVKSGKSNFT